jgi:HSP20 family protein
MAHRHTLDMFEVFYENLEKQLEEFFSIIEKPSEHEGEIIPPVDIYECSNSIHIEVELPGVKKDDILLTLQGGALQIEVVKKDEDKDTIKKNYICIERSFGTIRRRIDIKWACDTNRIKATMVNGLLTITIPKIEDRRGKIKKIEIEDS